MSITLNGDTGITTPMYNGTISANAVTPSVSMKNRLINSAMVIDQRNAGASVTAANDYTLDRWKAWNSQSSKYTVQQNAGSVTPPAGFSNYLGCTSSSAYSVLTGDYFFLQQSIEGYNIADLSWGTANAKTVTLSFQVYSSLTGTFGGAILNSATNRSYAFSYTISSANTWTSISVTITGDTSGTWLTTNGVGIVVRFGLGAGSTYSQAAGSWGTGNVVTCTGATSVVGTNGATFYITGVQLEVGSSATSFDYRQYTTELALCQRYFWMQANGSNKTISHGSQYNSTTAQFAVPLKVTMRTTPTLYVASGSNYFITYANTAGSYVTTLSINSASTAETALIYCSNSGTGGNATEVRCDSASSYVGYSAEL
jgi:hypothetical protein